MVLLKDVLEISPCEYIIINNADNPDDIKCIYEGYTTITDDACKMLLNEYSLYEVIGQEAFYDDEDDIVGIEIDIIKTESYGNINLKDLLMIVPQNVEVDIYDSNNKYIEGQRSSAELLEILSQDILMSNVVKFNPSCDFGDLIEVNINFKEVKPDEK